MSAFVQQPDFKESHLSHRQVESSYSSRMGRFGELVAAQRAVVSNQSIQHFAQDCPLRLPGSCPFGGICHSCPARVQAKLNVSQPGDPYEQETDRVTDQVMRMPEPCSNCGEEEKLQTKPLATPVTPLVQRQGDSKGKDKIKNPDTQPQSQPELSIRMDLYPEQPVDPAEVLLGTFAQRREKAQKTHGALAMSELNDVFIIMEVIAEQVKKKTRSQQVKPFISELHLLGHGKPGGFKFGSQMYETKDLMKIKSGKARDHMRAGATIYFEGCETASGVEGKKFMAEIGRIFFDNKIGYLWGNTCPVLGAVAEITTCKPITFKYPDEFKQGSHE